MKRLLVPVLILFVSIPALAQEVFSRYIAIEDYTGLSVIKVSTVDDFIDLARRNKVSTAFIKWKIDSGTSTVLVKVDSVFYSFELSGYSTVSDYLKGTRTGYPDGLSYYEAIKLGITQLDFYKYYKRNAFATAEDAKKAWAAGFVIDDLGKVKIVLPPQMTADTMKRLSDVIPPTAYKLDGTAYTLVYPDRRLTEDHAGDSGGARFKPADVLESHVYYFAALNGVATYKDYLVFSDSIKAGYESVADSVDAKKKGFENASMYYDAKVNGFAALADYQDARTYSIKTFEDYKPVREFNAQVAAIMKKEGKNYPDSVMVYALGLLPKNKIYQLSMIVDYIDRNIVKSGAFKAYMKKQGYTNAESTVREFLARHPSIAGGKYDAEAGVFQK